MGLGLRDRIVSFARERALATDCALIAAAIVAESAPDVPGVDLVRVETVSDALRGVRFTIPAGQSRGKSARSQTAR